MPTQGRLRTVMFAIISMAFGVVLCLLVAEVMCRVLPVNTGLMSQPVDDANPVLRFAPDRAFTYSRGWNFADVNRGTTNGDGWVSPVQYDSTARSPLLAVVGDSYVEAAMVPAESTLTRRLARLAEGRGRVYSFGASGAPLSQYLMEAQYARDHYHPTALAVVVVGNDFDESLMKYKSAPGFHYFADDGRGGLVLRRVDQSVSLGRRLARHSALAYYLLLNLHAQETIASLRASGRGAPATQYVGNTAADAGASRVADSQRAVDAFLAELPVRAGLPSSRIVLVVDAIRAAVYSPAVAREVAGSYFDVMRRYLATAARARGFEVVDLQPAFAARFASSRQRFEVSSGDDHWGARGHEVAADAIAGSGFLASVFSASAPCDSIHPPHALPTPCPSTSTSPR
ncbi:MAG TPA: hypothetical protein VFN38_00735 [Gemmatimonadaceae bacterium]|nr:hypothetical protein [Gemmatimonadaceae bacterium]